MREDRWEGPPGRLRVAPFKIWFFPCPSKNIYGLAIPSLAQHSQHKSAPHGISPAFQDPFHGRFLDPGSTPHPAAHPKPCHEQVIRLNGGFESIGIVQGQGKHLSQTGSREAFRHPVKIFQAVFETLQPLVRGFKSPPKYSSQGRFRTPLGVRFLADREAPQHIPVRLSYRQNPP